MDPDRKRIFMAAAQDLIKGPVNANCNKHEYIAVAVAASHCVLSQTPFSLNDVHIRDLQKNYMPDILKKVSAGPCWG